MALQRVVGVLFNYFDEIQLQNSLIMPEWIIKLLSFLLEAFNPTSDKIIEHGRYKGKPKGQWYFGGSWCDILPMDQEMWTKLMPQQFTELWCDIEQVDKVMNVLKEYWADNEGWKHTGTFSWELYPAGAGGYNSEHPGGAWIRPSYGRASFRIDVLWFGVDEQVPYDFYAPLWDKLVEEGIDFRPHWAKWYERPLSAW